MNDLTIIMLTANRVPEKWAAYHKQVLMDAIGDTPIITVSRKPLSWGTNIIQEGELGVNTIYRSILRACLLAETPFIAIVEDDTLYHKSHFLHRPPADSFGYEGHRWGLFTWGVPTYYYKDRISNATLIASRELIISSLEERFAVYPDTGVGELGKEKGMAIDRKNTVMFWSQYAVIYFSHVNSLDPTEQHKSKKMSHVQAYDIPYWGRAEDLVRHFV